MDSDLELTILMPCLNEAETLGTCIRKASSFLQLHGICGEILIADNGSTDGSQEIGRALGARVINVDQRGYGSALRAGIEAAQGRFVIMGDADDSYDFTSLSGFVDKLRNGADLVMGNRFKGGIMPGAMPPLHRYLGNPALSFIGRLLFGNQVRDFHCGLRGFARAPIQRLGLTTTGMEFASEMVAKGMLHDLRIEEVPTTLSPDGRSRQPHLRSWRDGWRHLRFLLLLSPRWLFLYPGLALFILGCAMMLWLLGAPRNLFGVTLDVNTLVFCSAAMVCGGQLTAFSLFSKLLAVRKGLHPTHDRLHAALMSFRIEYGIALGTLIFVIGLIASVIALIHWGHASFGDLIAADSLRIVIPASTALVLGLQMIFSSFFLGLFKDDQK